MKRIKDEYLSYLKTSLIPIVDEIKAAKGTHQQKAKNVNSEISKLRQNLVDDIMENSSPAERQYRLIILQYAVSVVSLEYRHAVWPYEYMALSRRVGELWERFCTAAWDAPSKPNVERIQAPNFIQVIEKIEQKLLGFVSPEHKTEARRIIDDMSDLIGEINMVEDEMFQVGDIPHIIDFKSGFGSNEKGNMLRLRTVGKAYRLWNPDTALLFLVRQDQNNNYLEVIKRDNMWDVHCGDSAYAKIEEITGAPMNDIRQSVIDFKNDLSEKFWADLGDNLSDLSGYLKW